MPKHTALWRALDDYFEFLDSSSLADKSVEDYYYFAEVFVRWLDGDAVPGTHTAANGHDRRSNGLLQVEARVPPPPRARAKRRGG